MQWNGTDLILVSNCALDIFQISRRRSTYSPQRQRTFMSSRIDGPNLQTLSILQLPRERGKLYSIRKASMANNVWQGRRHVRERKGSLCVGTVVVLPHGDYDTRQQTHDQCFNANVRLGVELGCILVPHRGTFITLRIWVSKSPADGFHPEMVIPTWLIFSHWIETEHFRPASSIVFIKIIRKRPQRIKFHIGK